MKVLFLQKDIFAKPGLMLLSSVLKQQGHQCEVLVEDLEKDIVGQALEINPGIIAFSITSIEAAWMSAVGHELRRRFPGYIICGGAHPTFLPEQATAEEYLDAICVGEGEGAIMDLINGIECGTDISRIPNLIVRKDGRLFRNEVRPLVEDLDTLPFPDRSIYERYKLYRKPHGGVLYHNMVMTSRGCPYECSYCFNKTYNRLYEGKGRIIRRRSVPNVIAELQELRAAGVKFFVFEDDSFTLPPREWVNDFLRVYGHQIGLPFKIQTPASLVDEDLMLRLKKANCFSLKMGIEAGNERFRNTILGKQVSDGDILQAARLAKQYGIRFQTFNMAGSPGETLDMVMETFDLNRRIRPDFVWCSMFHPVPETELYDYALANGYIDDSAYNIWTVGHSVFANCPLNINTPHRTEISNLQKLMYLCILLRVPRKLVKALIKIPVTGFYNLLFGMTFFLGMYRTNKAGVFDLARLSLVYWSKHIIRG